MKTRTSKTTFGDVEVNPVVVPDVERALKNNFEMPPLTLPLRVADSLPGICPALAIVLVVWEIVATLEVVVVVEVIAVDVTPNCSSETMAALSLTSRVDADNPLAVAPTAVPSIEDAA